MCEQLQTVGFHFDGTFAEFMEVPARAFSMGNVLVLENGVPTDQAVMAEPVACCVNGQEFLQLEEEVLSVEVLLVAQLVVPLVPERVCL